MIFWGGNCFTLEISSHNGNKYISVIYLLNLDNKLSQQKQRLDKLKTDFPFVLFKVLLMRY